MKFDKRGVRLRPSAARSACLAALSVGAAVFALMLSPVAAYANCNPAYPTNPGQSQDNPTNRPTGQVASIHDGQYVNPDIVSGYYLGGVYANTSFYNSPYVDPTTNTKNSWWIGEAAQFSVDGLTPLFQGGYWYQPSLSGSTVPTAPQALFVEEVNYTPQGSSTPCDCFARLLFDAPNTGPQYYLTITNGTNGWYNFFFNYNGWDGQGNDLLTSAYMGTNEVPWLTQGEMSGETYSWDSQMPGGYDDPVVFSDSHIYYNGAWLNFGPGQLLYNATYFNAAIISPTEFAMGDTACLT